MSKRFLFAIILTITILAAAGVAALASRGGDTVEINQEIAGSIINPIEVSTNAGTENRALLNLYAKGAPGAAEIEAVGGTVPAIAPSGLCPEGTDLELTFVDGGFVETFSDHSLLFYVIDDSDGAKNALCVDFQGVTIGVFDYVITGGAGRFEGATGNATVQITSWSVTGELSAETGTIHGSVHLP